MRRLPLKKWTCRMPPSKMGSSNRFVIAKAPSLGLQNLRDFDRGADEGIGGAAA